jgi:poly(beta-D-mannuronate) lyase
VKLHGVQRASVASNRFADSAPLRVVHTVGEPATEIGGNTFDRTLGPEIQELVAKGPHRAKLAGNIVRAVQP